MERIKQAIAKASKISPAVPASRDNFAGQVKRQEPDAPQQDAALNDIATIVLDKASLKTERIVAFDARDPKCASFDMLRTRVAQVMRQHNWRTIAITSPNPRTGKTTTAINLALSLARLHESKTVLVDFDLRNPTIAKYLKIGNQYDIADIINERIKLNDITVKTDIEDLYILSSRRPVSYSSELIGSPLTSRFIERLKSEFSDAFIVFDLPPMLVADDALSLLPYIDCMLLVAAVHETQMADLQECENKLENANYLGVVLNKVLGGSKDYKYY